MGVVCKTECVIKCESIMLPGMDQVGKVEYIRTLAVDYKLYNLALLILGPAHIGAASNELKNLLRKSHIYTDFDLVDARFLPERIQSAFSAESIEHQMNSVSDAQGIDGAGATNDLGEGPGPQKNLSTEEMRKWRSEVASKKPGAPLFEAENFEPVGILELIMGGDDMRSPSFLVGINKCPEKGQGYACKEVKPFVSYKCDTNLANQFYNSSLQSDLRQHLSRALPKYEFYSIILNLENLIRPVDFVRGTAFAVRPYYYAGGEKAATDYLRELEPGGANGIFFAYEVNLVRKTCCGGFIYRTTGDVSSWSAYHMFIINNAVGG